MGYRLNRVDEPISMTVSKPLLTESSIHYRLDSCEWDYPVKLNLILSKSFGIDQYTFGVDSG